MNRLPASTRAQIIRCLVEGNSIRATCRLTGAAKATVTKLLVDAGRACAAYQDANLRNLQCKRVQVDEIWSFVGAKARNVSKMKNPTDGAGDAWTWVGMCADSKLAISWLVGDRDAVHAHAFIHDIWERLESRVQLTSDGWAPYLGAVSEVFGMDVDFAQLVKRYGASPNGPQTRYSPAECIGADKRPIEGKPDPKHISTSYIERQNLTMRMSMRRFTRLTNAFSKKIENHAYAVSLHFMYYNFVRIHKTLRVTPAMAAGVTDKLWEVSDIVAVIEEYETALAAYSKASH